LKSERPRRQNFRLEVWISDDHHSLKKRIKAVPAILSRHVDQREQSIDLSRQWGKDLIEGQALRNRVMHCGFAEPLARISMQELVRSANAICAFFEELAVKLPSNFSVLKRITQSETALLELCSRIPESVVLRVHRKLRANEPHLSNIVVVGSQLTLGFKPVPLEPFQALAQASGSANVWS
jgi:hypothetical protein